MSLIITICKAFLSTITVISLSYLICNIVLPLFNIKLKISIKLYKTKKVL